MHTITLYKNSFSKYHKICNYKLKVCVMADSHVNRPMIPLFTTIKHIYTKCLLSQLYSRLIA